MEELLPLTFTLLASGLLGLMCYQDWQARSISWPAFPALAVALLGVRLGRLPAVQVGAELLLSWTGLGLLLAALWLYVRLRFRSLRLRECLGSGDVLYWAIAAVYFSPIGFLTYFIGSSLVALLVAAALYWRQTPSAEATHIPLAGVQAACLLVLLGLQAVAPVRMAYWADSALSIAWTP